MPDVAERMECTAEQREALTKFTNSRKFEKRLVDGARMVLGCAQGHRIKDTAKDPGGVCPTLSSNGGKGSSRMGWTACTTS